MNNFKRIILHTFIVAGILLLGSCKSSVFPDPTEPVTKVVFEKGEWELVVTGTGFEDTIIIHVVEGESLLLESSSSQCEIISVNGKAVATNPVQTRTLNFWPEKKVDVDIAYVETEEIWPRYIITGTHTGTAAVGVGAKYINGAQLAVTFTMRKI